MVEDVGLGDTVRGVGSEPAHELATVSKQAAIKGGKSSARERESIGTVVGHKWIGMLQKGNQYQPVVDPEFECQLGKKSSRDD